MDNNDFAASKLVEAIRAAFPEDAAWVDKQVQAQGFERTEASYIWVERFSQCTTNYLKAPDQSKAGSHLGLISALLGIAQRTNDSAMVRCIDVAYSENLMFDMNEERKKQCWPLIPQNLKTLYVDMWGGMPFMRKRGRRAK